jgi:hypothetical protein
MAASMQKIGTTLLPGYQGGDGTQSIPSLTVPQARPFVYLSSGLHTITSGIEVDQRNLARFACRLQTTDFVYTRLAGANFHDG